MRRNHLFQYMIMFIILLVAFNCKAQAEGNYRVVIQDNAELLSDEEEAKLAEEMQRFTENGHVMFYTSIYDMNPDSEGYSNQFYDAEFNGEPGMALVIDLGEGNSYLFKRKGVLNRINEVTILQRGIYGVATPVNGSCYNYASGVFQQMETKHKEKEAMHPLKKASNLVLAFIFSILINYLIMRKTSSVKGVRMEQLYAGKQLEFKMSEPRIRFISSRKINNNSNH